MLLVVAIMCDVLKQEFKLKNLLFGHTKPESFYTAQWRWHPLIYVVYRVVIFLYCLGWLLDVTISSIHNNDHHNVMVYMTVWTYLVLCLYQLSAVISAVYGGIRRRGLGNQVDDRKAVLNARFTQSSNSKLDSSSTNPAFDGKHSYNGTTTGHVEIANSNGTVEKAILNGKASPDEESMSLCTHTVDIAWHMKVQWLLANVIYTFAPVVTAVYFIALYPWGNGIDDGAEFAMDMNVHAFNTLLILIDVAIVARPVRLLHFIYPIAYGLLYIIFGAIYWSEDKQGNVLYDVLDYNNAGKTVVVVLLLGVAALVLHIVQFALFRLRLFVYTKLYGTDYF